MKKLFVLSLIVLAQQLAAQPTLKVYAFSRVFVPGMAKSREIAKTSNKTVYYIYVLTQAGTTIQPKEIFVKDHWYQITSYKTVKTPVNTKEAPVKKLVPASKNKVIQIELGTVLQNGSVTAEKNRKNKSTYELFISYLWKGKIYYTSLRNIKSLDPVKAI